MKVLVQDLRTGLFYGERGNWVSSRDRAFDFEQSRDAMRHCIDKNIRPGQVLLYFPESGNEVIMPVPTRFPNPEWPALVSVAGLINVLSEAADVYTSLS